MKRTRLLLLLLLIVLLMSACAASPAEQTPIALALRDPITDGTADGEGIAVAFSVTTPLTGLELECSITGESPEITLQIFKADTDYATTVAADPLREETVPRLSSKILWQFDPLEEGDYILLFSKVRDAQPFLSLQASAEATGRILHLRNGSVMTEGTVVLTLFCTPTKEIPHPGLAIFTYPVVEE